MARTLLDERKLLLRLAQSGYQLLSPLSDDKGLWHVLREADGKRPIVAKTPDALVRKLIANGALLHSTCQGWPGYSDQEAKLSRAGKLLLKRHLANADQHEDKLGGNNPHARQHRLLKTHTIRGDAGEPIDVTSNLTESPLGWLATRRGKDGMPLITTEQLEAGERFRGDFERGSLMGSIGRNWERLALPQSHQKGAGSEGLSTTEGGMAARQRFYRALGGVGEELAPVLVLVCCEQRGLEETEKKMGWPKRTGKVVLKMALNQLARHYGFIGTSGNGKAAPLQHWGEADYRPVIE